MALLHKESNDHLVFLGPVLLHVDPKTDTYVTFFSQLSSALGACASDINTELLDDAIEDVHASSSFSTADSAIQSLLLRSR